MTGPNQYQISCDCGTVRLSLTGEPLVRGFCHCGDCRDLLKTPYHSVIAWEREQVVVEKGAEDLAAYQSPTRKMARFYCAGCGDTVFNSNAKDWRVVSQLLASKCYGGELPERLQPTVHFYYGQRIVDIDDNLPKRD